METGKTLENPGSPPLKSGSSPDSPLQEITSILEPGRADRFRAFHEEILFGGLSLQDIAARTWLHQGLLEFQFEQLGDLGTTEDPVNGRVVLLRVDGHLLAVRAVHAGTSDESQPIVSLPATNGQIELQVLSCDDFLSIWSHHTGLAPEIYNTVSSIQPYMQSLITGSCLHLHGRELVVDAVLGQGLEGTVFSVRDTETHEAFALKVTHKDVRELYARWTAGLQRIRREAPDLLPHLCEFVSIEWHGDEGCTVLLQYRPLISFREFLGPLAARERLRQGLRVLGGCIRVVQTLRQMDICHGDIGVSNLFIYPEADGIDQLALIDPHPDGLLEGPATVRKDLFGLAHMLYWLVTGTEWPEGTQSYLQRVLAGEHDRGAAKEVFRAAPLCEDGEYKVLHEAAISSLAGSADTSDEICELILIMSDRLSSSEIAAPGRVVRGESVTAASVERLFNNVLRPIGSGVFLPVFSLPSYFNDVPGQQRDYGMGDTGPAAREFVLRLKATGQKYWCILPVGPTDDRNCVYRSDSVFAMGLNTVPPADLLKDGWITAAELDEWLPAVSCSDRIPLDDPGILYYKRSLLELAWQRYRRDLQWKDQFYLFQQQEAGWLYDYCTYKAIEAEHPGRWTTWPTELRDAEPSAMRAFAATHAEEIQREAFYQFLAQHYFLKLRCFAESHGILLIGDLPAFSAHGSADVWARRDVFELAPDGQRTLVAGAPPDMFDPQGQAWNHPMYRWDSKATVEFHASRFARMKRLFGRGFLRDDHIIGRITPWGFPFGTKPADGRRITGEFLGNALFDAIFTRVPGLQQSLIGEDLGVVTDETTLLMKHYGLLGMRVLQFIPFHADQAVIDADMYTPGNYADRNLVLLGTHDTPTIRQWWRYGLDDAGRRHVGEFLRRRTGREFDIHDRNAADILSEFAAKQTAHMIIHQMPDLLVDDDGGSGLVNARMNDPALGEADGRWKDNWSWRMSPGGFNRQIMDRLTTITNDSCRAPERAVQRLPLIPADAEEVLLACRVLRHQVEGGATLADQLEQLARDGRIRSVCLGSDLLSAVCGHTDGHAYLLISDSATNHLHSVPERAVSLVHALEQSLRHDEPYYRSPFERFSEESLIRTATDCMKRMEEQLQQLAAFSDRDAKERMVTFLGGRLSAGLTARAADVAASLHLQSTWTEFWLHRERRGICRENIIDELLVTSDAELRGIRWSLLSEYAEDIHRIDAVCVVADKAAESWCQSLSAGDTEKLLFGTHDGGAQHSAPQGISDTLHQLHQYRRRELDPAQQNAEARLPDIVRSLIRGVGADPGGRQLILHHVDTVLQHGVSALAWLLSRLEQHLTRQLSETAEHGTQASRDYPPRIDTQIHSFHSDCAGQSIARIVHTAAQRGLRTIAVTDHQTFDGVIEAIDIGHRLGVEVIPAVELYTGIKRGDGPVEDRRDVLVYFPDTDRFRDWYDRGLDAETLRLFDDGWNRKVNGSRWGDVPIARVTGWARAHGGVPVLAHPGLLSAEQFHRDNWSFTAFERLFLDSGLAGIEISHSKLPFAENTVRYVPLVQEFNRRHPDRPLIFTVGTDSHTPDGLGRANLTAETVRFLTEQFRAGNEDSSSLQQMIVDSIRQAAQRIADHSELYRLRSDVLQHRFPGTTVTDRPLPVFHTTVETPHESLIAGRKSWQGQPLIVVINRGRTEQHEGKDWGRLDVTEALQLTDGSSRSYDVRDVVSGAHYHRTAEELAERGLHVGLLPYATQFLQITPSED